MWSPDRVTTFQFDYIYFDTRLLSTLMFKFEYYGEYYEDIISNEKQTLHWKKGNVRNEGIILVTGDSFNGIEFVNKNKN